MRLVKSLISLAAVAAMSTVFAISASATTYKDAVQAAKNNGVQVNNVKELENFLEPNADYFTSDEYDYMIADINAVGDKYVRPLAKKLFNKEPIELTEEEKIDLGQNWTMADRSAIIGDLIALGKRYDVVITVEPIDKAHYHCEAYIKGRDGSNKDPDSSTPTDKDKDSSKGTTGGNVQIATDKPVADTGVNVSDEKNADTGVSASTAALIALAAASAGIALVARKNKS